MGRVTLDGLLNPGSVAILGATDAPHRVGGRVMRYMHEAGFELFEIPHVSYSGKNSADIHMVVDAVDLCYSKSHIDVFALLTGDSDFSPLASKLKELLSETVHVVSDMPKLEKMMVVEESSGIGPELVGMIETLPFRLETLG